jgi:hypothetical protein
MRNVCKLTTAAFAMLGVLAFVSVPAFAGNGYETVTGKFGSKGSEPGQFNEPTSIAVNDENEDVYVLDSGNDRIEWFSAEGKEYKGQFDETTLGEKFVKPTQIAVNNGPGTAKGDVYVADTGADVIDEFSATGKYEGQIEGGKCENEEEGQVPPCTEGMVPNKVVPFKGLLDVAVDPAGNIWVYEAEHAEVYEFSETGGFAEKFHLPAGETVVPGFAVDSHGNVYVTRWDGQELNGGVVEYENGTDRELSSIVSFPASVAPSVSLAIIASSNDLLIDDVSTVELYRPPFGSFEAPFRTFPTTGLSESAGIAVDGAKGDGTLYATERSADEVDVFAPGLAEAPTVGGESASTVNEPGMAEFAAVIDPENRTTTYTFEYARTQAAVLEGKGEKVSGEAPAEFGEETFTSPAVELSPYNETFYYRVVAENELSKGVPTVGEVKSYTKLPLVANEKFSDLTSTSAKLEATVNPVFIANLSKYFFEYSTSKGLLEEDKGTVAGESPLEEEVNTPLPVSTEVAGLKPGETYYYRVVTENELSKHKPNANKGEPIRGKIETFTPYGFPAATTGATQSITQTAATLSGEVDPEGTEATYYFEYIGNTAYEKAEKEDAEEKARAGGNPYSEGETTTPITLSASNAPQSVGEIPVSGLLPGETYHYALVATNKFELRTVGKDATFTTHTGTPPLVSTGAASGVSQNAATLYGTITTNGLQTNYGFEIGTAPGNYGPATGLGAIGGAQTEEVHVTLAELQPGTTYYYRVTATNADGTTPGQPATFTTPGFPTLLVAPPSPAQFAFTKVAFPKEEKGSGTGTKALTKKERLAKALSACRKEKSRSRRSKCEAAAHKKYPVAKAKKGKAKK